MRPGLTWWNEYPGFACVGLLFCNARYPHVMALRRLAENGGMRDKLPGGTAFLRQTPLLG
jgi:hypothetical protein